MNAKLARILVQNGIIRQGTIIEAYESAKGISCQCDSHKLTEFVVRRATSNNGIVYFEAISGREEQPRRIRSDYVATVDGMAVDRLTLSHGLTQDGERLFAPSHPKYRRALLAKYAHDQKSQSVADHAGGDQPFG